jgi:beta-lactam-binding protein with PASTA domain
VKRWFRLILLGLVLLLVTLVSALTAMRYAIHGREVRVPDLAGMTPARAEAVLGNEGLMLEIDDHFYSPSIPEGQIVSQAPAARTRVRRGWRVKVALSLGTPRAPVPDVTGESGRAGEINVQRRGLVLGTVAVVHLPGLPADQVIAESPPPSATAVFSPKVSLLITAPEEDQNLVMPDLTNRSLAAAAQAIQNAGLKLGNFPQSAGPNDTPVAQIPPELAAARISGQSPAAGQKVTPGTVVVLQFPRPTPPSATSAQPAAPSGPSH